MNSIAADVDEHPDELTLVAWSEDRLLDFERDEVEQHLADCRACRELVAALEHDRRAAPRRRFPLRLVLSAAAAAAVLLVALWIPWNRLGPSAAPALELALAGSRETVFETVRSAPVETGEVYVGVRLVATAWIRLVALDDAGGVFEVPLDPGGATTASFAGASDHVFGPYPLELSSGHRVTAYCAVASADRLAWPELEACEWPGVLDDGVASSIGDRLGAGLVVAAVPGSR